MDFEATQPTIPENDFYIGNTKITRKAILAPMDGITDSPFRLLCRSMGSAYSISEFVNALNYLNGHPFIKDQLPFDALERPFAYQIFDNDIERIEKTALALLPYQPDFIDINMGCSNRSVSNRGAGAGLMREPGKVAALVKRLVKILPVPVTAKIRLGWDDQEKNYLEIADILEQAGCSCIALHARTRVQQYGGNADWDAIASLVQHVHVPVIGNGDITHPDQIEQMLFHTGCQAVMIGRAAIGNPWIFAGLDLEQISAEERLNVMKKHLTFMVDYYGEKRAPILFRKHIRQYLKFTGIAKEDIQKSFYIESADKLAQYLQELLLVT